MIAGAEFCSHCGARAQRADDSTAAPLACPRCATALAAVLVGASRIHDCATCGGVWLDVETFQRIANDGEVQSGVLAVLAPTPPTATVSAADIRYVPCPVCAKLMNRMNFARISGVILDSCKQHGNWFDRDELRRVIEFVRAGGLAAARNKEKLALEEERRLLDATKQYAAARPDPAGRIRLDQHDDVVAVTADLGKVLTTLLGLGVDVSRGSRQS
jgi:Zn-finger nucleic acid-binding protein